MSWNINIVGKPADVKAVIQAEKYLPQPLKDTIALFADSYANKPDQLIQVKSYGHFDLVYGGSVGNFSIEQVTLVVAPSTPAITK